MANELLPFAVLIAITLWLAIKHVLAAIERERQLEIARRGESCDAKIIGIQRPFVLDTCTRLYFDYVPRGSERPVRACHVERRSPDAFRRSLPAAGSIVTVRYLPDRPKFAVIARLISASESV
jgi:hypothetical protein